MALTLLNKALISGVFATSLGGATYGAYTLLSKTETVKDALIKKQIDPLNFENKSEEDLELLKELAKQYHSNKPTTKKQKIQGFELTSGKEFEKLEAKCKELLSTKSGHKDFNKNLEHATNWCSKGAAPRSVASLLKSKRKELLKEGGDNDGDWNQPWKTFKDTHKAKAPNGSWLLDNWNNLSTNEPEVLAKFKKKCIENGGKTIMPKEDATFLKEIIDYCTKQI